MGLRKCDEAYKRMVEEHNELKGKIERLENMIKQCRNHQREDISLEELHLMEEQIKPMQEYATVLGIRIFRVKE